MNLRHLRAIPEIVAKRHVGRAACAAALSQPALTQGLARLEQQLNAELFARQATGITARPAGLLLAERVAAADVHLVAATRGAPSGHNRAERIMTSPQLRAFLAVADRGGYVSAAVETRLTEPALHRSVRALAKILGRPLVERRGRGIALTLAGRRLARGIRLAAAELAVAIAEIDPAGDGGRIAIGAMPLSRAALVPEAVARLSAERPGVTISIIEGSWRELVESLRDGVIDIMLGALRPDLLPDLEQRPLFSDRPTVIAGARHPLAGKINVSSSQLAAFPWIVGHVGSPLRQQWDAMFAAGQLPLPHRPIECGSVVAIRGLLTRGDFLTLLSRRQVAVEVFSGQLAPIDARIETVSRTVGATVRQNWRPSSAQQSFLDHLATAARII